MFPRRSSHAFFRAAEGGDDANQDGVVVDHPTGRTWRLREYLPGDY